METTITLTQLFQHLTLVFNLQPHVLESVCYVETGHNVSAYVPDDKGSPTYGICQVKLTTAQAMGYKGSAIDLMRPEVNSYYAAAYLAYQVRRYHNNLARAVTAYNKGNSSGDGNTAYYRSVKYQMNYLNNSLINSKTYDNVYKQARTIQNPGL
jgi:soluble lytic murein transglycosylase-like protein